MVRGDTVGFKRYTKDGTDLEEPACANPASVTVRYDQGRLVEARLTPEDNPAADEGPDVPAEQVFHLTWDAPDFSPRGNSIVLVNKMERMG